MGGRNNFPLWEKFPWQIRSTYKNTQLKIRSFFSNCSWRACISYRSSPGSSRTVPGLAVFPLVRLQVLLELFQTAAVLPSRIVPDCGRSSRTVPGITRISCRSSPELLLERFLAHSPYFLSFPSSGSSRTRWRGRISCRSPFRFLPSVAICTRTRRSYAVTK